METSATTATIRRYAQVVLGCATVCVLGLWPLSAGAQNDIFHSLRRVDGSWLSFSGLRYEAGAPGVFGDVSIGGNSSTGELHLVGKTSDGNLWHTIRRANGTWSPFDSLWLEIGLPPDHFIRVSVSANAATGELHVMGLDPNGNLWHGLRRGDGSWRYPNPWDSLWLEIGLPPNHFSGVSISANSATGQLHVIGVDPNGNLWHGLRYADGTWRYPDPWDSLWLEIGLPGQFTSVSTAANPATGELHVVGLTSDGSLYHTIRRADGSWQYPWIALPGTGFWAAVSIASNPITGELHLTGIGSNGYWWHSTRQPDGTWSAFDWIASEILPFCDANKVTTDFVGPILHAATYTYEICIP